jgi:hypothetical protein
MRSPKLSESFRPSFWLPLGKQKAAELRSAAERDPKNSQFEASNDAAPLARALITSISSWFPFSFS